MAVRSYEQIFNELGSIYTPQENLVRQRQQAIPGMVAEEERGLQAKQENAFSDILGGARRRGLGFSGIPLQEQARYTASEYLPALARLRQSGREQATSLEEAILGINERRAGQANTLRQADVQNDLAERQFAESQRQFNEQLRAQAEANRRAAAAASAFSPSYGGGGAPGGGGLPAGMAERRDSLGKLTGYNFTVGGKPASAASFAAANRIPVGDLLYQMGASGDTTAQQAYNWVKAIQGSDLFNSGRYKQTPAYQRFGSLFWGS